MLTVVHLLNLKGGFAIFRYFFLLINSCYKSEKVRYDPFMKQNDIEGYGDIRISMIKTFFNRQMNDLRK